MIINIIGIDCATEPKKVGLTLGVYQDGGVVIREVMIGSIYASVIRTIESWISTDPPSLIAIDAPLGWPYDLGRTLYTHKAGELIQIKPNSLFRRQTDRFITERIGKQPLDVGADRIARTAHKALEILGDLRQKKSIPIPLAWGPIEKPGIYALEVYPAATLKACDILITGYKQKENRVVREKLVNSLSKYLTLPEDTSQMINNDDALDATVCVLAGADFLNGIAMKPSNNEIDTAKKEGWIWVRDPTTNNRSKTVR